MLNINIEINAVGDPPCCTHCQPCQEGIPTDFAILEKGTEEGHTSTGLFIKLKDGSYVWAQITASMFLAMAGAVRGACERFGDEKNL